MLRINHLSASNLAAAFLLLSALALSPVLSLKCYRYSALKGAKAFNETVQDCKNLSKNLTLCYRLQKGNSISGACGLEGQCSGSAPDIVCTACRVDLCNLPLTASNATSAIAANNGTMPTTSAAPSGSGSNAAASASRSKDDGARKSASSMALSRTLLAVIAAAGLIALKLIG